MKETEKVLYFAAWMEMVTRRHWYQWWFKVSRNGVKNKDKWINQYYQKTILTQTFDGIGIRAKSIMFPFCYVSRVEYNRTTLLEAQECHEKNRIIWKIWNPTK